MLGGLISGASEKAGSARHSIRRWRRAAGHRRKSRTGDAGRRRCPKLRRPATTAAENRPWGPPVFGIPNTHTPHPMPQKKSAPHPTRRQQMRRIVRKRHGTPRIADKCINAATPRRRRRMQRIRLHLRCARTLTANRNDPIRSNAMAPRHVDRRRTLQLKTERSTCAE